MVKTTIDTNKKIHIAFIFSYEKLEEKNRKTIKVTKFFGVFVFRMCPADFLLTDFRSEQKILVFF